MDLTYLDRASPGFPQPLADIPGPPQHLWVRGVVPALSRPSVAIVGSRRASPGSLEIARRLAAELARIGLTIVSGLARGCAGAAHQGALDAGGVTVAVLGSGADVIYPPEHTHLADTISRSGAVISELPPGSPPLPHHFRARNRLISGLARGVVVIEANDKSGSLITAGCALAPGREVMVVPGTVFAGRNRGGHQLIRDGAALVETAEDVLAVLVGAAGAVPLAGRVPRDAEGVASSGTGGAEDPVLAVLDPVEPLDLDEVVRLAAMSGGAVIARLAELEVAGVVKRVSGGRFVRSSGKVLT